MMMMMCLILDTSPVAAALASGAQRKADAAMRPTALQTNRIHDLPEADRTESLICSSVSKLPCAALGFFSGADAGSMPVAIQTTTPHVRGRIVRALPLEVSLAVLLVTFCRMRPYGTFTMQTKVQRATTFP